MRFSASVLWQEDNEAIAFGDRQDVCRCPSCLTLVDKWSTPLTGLRLRRRHFDISTTYDGVTVVSRRFAQWLDRLRLGGVEVRQLPDDRQFYQLIVRRVVELDAVRQGVLFEDRCPICGRYDSVVRAFPVYLKADQVVAECDIVRTDLEFGTADEQSPLLIVGNQLADMLRETGMRGFSLEECA